MSLLIPINSVPFRMLPLSPRVLTSAEHRVGEFIEIRRLVDDNFEKFLLVDHYESKERFYLYQVRKLVFKEYSDVAYTDEIIKMYQVRHDSIVPIVNHFEDKQYLNFLLEYDEHKVLSPFVPQGLITLDENIISKLFNELLVALSYQQQHGFQQLFRILPKHLFQFYDGKTNQLHLMINFLNSPYEALTRLEINQSNVQYFKYLLKKFHQCIPEQEESEDSESDDEKNFPLPVLQSKLLESEPDMEQILSHPFVSKSTVDSLNSVEFNNKELIDPRLYDYLLYLPNYILPEDIRNKEIRFQSRPRKFTFDMSQFLKYIQYNGKIVNGCFLREFTYKLGQFLHLSNSLGLKFSPELDQIVFDHEEELYFTFRTTASNHYLYNLGCCLYEITTFQKYDLQNAETISHNLKLVISNYGVNFYNLLRVLLKDSPSPYATLATTEEYNYYLRSEYYTPSKTSFSLLSSVEIIRGLNPPVRRSLQNTYSSNPRLGYNKQYLSRADMLSDMRLQLKAQTSLAFKHGLMFFYQQTTNSFQQFQPHILMAGQQDDAKRPSKLALQRIISNELKTLTSHASLRRASSNSATTFITTVDDPSVDCDEQDEQSIPEMPAVTQAFLLNRSPTLGKRSSFMRQDLAKKPARKVSFHPTMVTVKDECIPQRSLEDYIIERRIEYPWSDEIYLVRDRKTGQPFTMQIIDKSKLYQPDAAIKREIDKWKLLMSEYVVKIEECFEKDDKIYMITQYFAQGSLSRHLPIKGEAMCRMYFKHILEGLLYLHSKYIFIKITIDTIVLTDTLTPMIANLALQNQFRGPNSNMVLANILHRIIYGLELQEDDVNREEIYNSDENKQFLNFILNATSLHQILEHQWLYKSQELNISTAPALQSSQASSIEINALTVNSLEIQGKHKKRNSKISARNFDAEDCMQQRQLAERPVTHAKNRQSSGCMNCIC